MTEVMTRQVLEDYLRGCQDWRVTFITGDSKNPNVTTYSNSIIANTMEFIEGEPGMSDAVVFTHTVGERSYAELIMAVNNLQEVFRDDEILVYLYPHIEITVPDMDKHPYIVIEKDYAGKEGI